MIHVQRLGAVLTMSAIFLGCSDSELPKYQVLNTLRIAAIELDQPELNYDGAAFPSATLAFTPWISDTNGNGRTLNLSIAYCLDPGLVFGALPTCTGSPTRVVVQNPTAISTLANQFAAPNYTGAIAPISIALGSTPALTQSAIQAAFLSASTSTRFNGVVVLFEFMLETASGDERVAAIKRVLLSSSEKTTKNQNPSGLEVRMNGADLGTAWPTVDSDLSAYWPNSSAENYSLRSVDGTEFTRDESLTATWFLTGSTDDICNRETDCAPDGVLNLTRSSLNETNRYEASESPPTSRGTVALVVLQDDRGGTSVRRLCSGAVCP
jgi:hypothetical protein